MKDAKANSANFIEILDSLSREYATNQGGYHQRAYSLMAKGMSVVLLLRTNKNLEREFIRRVRPKSNGKASPSSINLVTEVMAYVMGAKTEPNRKIAWKRGRVIEFLHGKGVKIAKISAEIKSRGGIEAILRQAAKQKPRRNKKPAATKNKVKEAAGIAATAEASPRKNDNQVIMPVLINLSDRDFLYELPENARVKIYATRCSKAQAEIEVSGYKKLKPEVSKLDDDDWD